MFYIGYPVVFIGCYFQPKSKVLHNNSDCDGCDVCCDDRRGANAQVGALKGV